MAGHAERHRHDGRGAGRDGERRPAGHRRSDRVRFGQAGSRRRGAGAARHAAGAGAAGRRRSAARSGAPQLRADAGPAERARHLARRVRPRHGRADGRRRRGSARSAPRSSGRRSGRRSPASSASARSTSASTSSGGDAMVTLQSLNPIYVNFGVPQQAAGQMRVGRSVRITADDLAGVELAGRVTAIDSIVDEATRNVQVQATLANPDGRLRPGMFVQTEVIAGRQPRRRRAAGVRDQLRAVRRLGLRRHRPQGRERPDLPRRAPAVRQARRRARRSDRGRLRRQRRATRS